MLLGIVGLTVFSERKLWQQVAFSLGVPIVYIIVATLAWIYRSSLVPVVGPVLGFAALQVFMIIRRVLVEQRAKEQITGAFSTYLSPTLVDRLATAGLPTPSAMIAWCRLTLAAQMLEDPARSVEQIALLLDF